MPDLQVNLGAYANRMLAGYANICLVGDSLSTIGATPRHLGGILRTFNRPCVGLFTPGYASASNEGINNFSSPAPLQLTAPGGTLAVEGVTNDWPMSASEISLGLNYTDNQNMNRPALIKSTLDLMPYEGNPTEGGSWNMTFVYRRTGTEPTDLSINTRIEGTNSTRHSGLNFTTNGVAGTTSYDLAFPATDGSHASDTDIYIGGGATNETGTKITILGLRWYKPSATEGYEVCGIGQGGWSTSDHLASGGDEKYTDAEFENFLTLAGNPNCFQIQIGQNDGLTKAAFKANVETIISRIKARCAAVGTVNPLFLLVSTWDTLSDNSRFIGYADAQREIASGDGDVAFVDLRRKVELKYGAWNDWKGTLLHADGVHQKDTAAADEFMTLLYDEFAIAGAGESGWHKRAGLGGGMGMG